MPALSGADVAAVRNFNAQAAEIGVLTGDVLGLLGALIPCDNVDVDALDFARRSLLPENTWSCDDVPWDDQWAAPDSAYRRRTGHSGALALRDVVSAHGLRSRADCAFYREYHVTDELSVSLSRAPLIRRNVVLTRQGGRFSERDRTLLDLLHPQLQLLSLARRQVELTPRQREVLTLVREGRTNKEIARELWISPGTVRKHLENLYEALGVTNRTEAAACL